MTTFSIRGYKVEEFIGSYKPICIFMYEDGCDFRDYNKFGQDISFSPNSNSTMYPNGIIDAYMPLIKLHPTLDMLTSDKLLNFQSANNTIRLRPI